MKKIVITTLLLFAFNIQAENNYCDKYKGIFYFLYQNSNHKACLAGQEAFRTSGPDYCRTYSIIDKVTDIDIFKICLEGYRQAEELAKSVDNSSRKRKEEIFDWDKSNRNMIPSEVNQDSRSNKK